jgi:hypothetical protein
MCKTSGGFKNDDKIVFGPGGLRRLRPVAAPHALTPWTGMGELHVVPFLARWAPLLYGRIGPTEQRGIYILVMLPEESTKRLLVGPASLICARPAAEPGTSCARPRCGAADPERLQLMGCHSDLRFWRTRLFGLHQRSLGHADAGARTQLPGLTGRGKSSALPANLILTQNWRFPPMDRGWPHSAATA